MGLASLAKKARGAKHLKTLIEENLGEKRTVAPMDADGWIRVSSLYRICAREEVICSRFQKERKDDISPSLAMIFNHGHGLHWALQNIVLPEIGVLKGQWTCLRCGKRHGGRQDDVPLHRTVVFRPDACRRCGFSLDKGQDTFVFNELHFQDDSLRLTGHPDGFLQVPSRSGLGVAEGKSIGERGAWEVRHTPKVDHVIQAQAYMMLTKLDWAVIIYWNKGGYGDDTIYEHFVERDDDTILAIRSMIRSIRSGIRDKEYPDRICENASCARAGKCSVADLCFDPDKLYAQAK